MKAYHFEIYEEDYEYDNKTYDEIVFAKNIKTAWDIIHLSYPDAKMIRTDAPFHNDNKNNI